MTRLVNLIPHPLRIQVDERTPLTLPAALVPARVREIMHPAGSLTVDGVQVPVADVVYESVITGLPDATQGVAYVVSRVTAYALADRDDVYFPVGELRDAEGQICGCRSLGRFGPHP